MLVLCALAAGQYFWAEPSAPTPANPLAEDSYAISRVVDGDTIIVAPNTRVRLLGIDTPETVRPEHPVEPFGPEATAFTRRFLADGTARLTFDRERFDRFGRHLAYVWVDGQLLNEELLRAGLARWEPQFNYAEPMKRRFKAAQREAQDAQRGVWSAENDGP